MILSSSPATSLHVFGNSFFFIKKHIIFLLIGLIAFSIGFIIPYQAWKKLVIPLLIVTLFLLILTYIPGINHTAGGASRWLDLGFFTFQPSELAKFTLALYVAVSLSNKTTTLKMTKTIMPTLGLITVFLMLILKQPDLGTAISIVLTFSAMFFVWGLPVWFMTGASLLGSAVMYKYIQHNPYQLKRVQAFINPWADPHGIGFQQIQSLIAVGNGGILGQGLGNSRQKFFYLPQQYTDFIFSIISEELGFIMTSTIILMFLLLAFRGIRIADQIDDLYGKLLAVGLITWISIQAFLNMGVVLSILPTTGIPLPFISYGGTSLVMLLFSSGIIANISRYRNAQ
jgi:cell division protein FtsW